MAIKTLLQMADRLGAAGTLLSGDLPRIAVEAGSLAAKTTILASLTRVVPSRRLRNVGKAGAPLSVSYDVTGTTDPIGLVRAGGPWQLVESDTRPHPIVAKGVGKNIKGRGSTHAKKQAQLDALFGGNQQGIYGGTHALSTPYGPRFRVNHPGTRGRHPWRDGVLAAQITVPVAMRAPVVEGVEKVLSV